MRSCGIILNFLTKCKVTVYTVENYIYSLFLFWKYPRNSRAVWLLIQPNTKNKVHGMAKIMLVDDEPDILFLVGVVLKKEGYEVIKASSREECLEKLKKEKVDLILLDILGVGGDRILAEIKNDGRFKSIPIAMFTVVREEKAARMFRCTGYDAYIEKPFERDKMLETVQALLTSEKAVA